MKKLLLIFLLLINGVANATITEYLGAGSKYIEFVGEIIPTNSFLQWTFTETSKYDVVDFTEDNETTASVKYMLPSGVVDDSDILTSGSPKNVNGYDIIEVRINNTQGSSVAFNGRITIYQSSGAGVSSENIALNLPTTVVTNNYFGDFTANDGVIFGNSSGTENGHVIWNGSDLVCNTPTGQLSLLAGAAGGEANTLGSIGSGITLNASKSGTTLQLKSVVGSTNITVLSSADGSEIHIIGDISDHAQLTSTGNNTHDAIDAHIANTTNNVHGVTAEQVSNNVALWNASQIQGVTVDITGLVTGNIMRFDGTTFVSDNNLESIIIPLTSISGTCSAGTAKNYFRMPYAFYVTEVRANVITAPSAYIMFDINEAGTTILSTKLHIDATETTSTGANTANVICDPYIADNAEMKFDIDRGDATGAGAQIIITGYRL